MSDKKSFIFFGNERLATGVVSTTPILNTLINKGYLPKLIVVSNTTSKTRSLRELEVISVARTHNIPVLNTKNNNELIEHIRAINPVFGVLAAYGRIVPKSILDLFPSGIINVHPSLLPKHRGPTPIESVILQGESQTGVSIMRLSEQMDAGAVYLQKSMEVTPEISKQQLMDQLSHLGAELLAEHIEAIVSGTMSASEQNYVLATYDTKIHKSDGHINWSKSAEQLSREVRAYAVWPQSHATIGRTDGIIVEARTVAVSEKVGVVHNESLNENRLVIGCGNASLEIMKIKPHGKAVMTAQAFLAGYRQKL